MDEKGYLRFRSHAAPIREGVSGYQVKRPSRKRGVNKDARDISNGYCGCLAPPRMWDTVKEEEPIGMYAVSVGKCMHYSLPEQVVFPMPNNGVLMLVKRHGGNKFHRVLFVFVPYGFWRDWSYYEFSIGGPEELPCK